MREGPILFCYDGSPAARHAIEASVDLLPERRAVVINVGPLEAVSVVYAAAGSGAAGFDREIEGDVRARAEEGARLAGAAGFHAAPRAELETDAWRGIVEVADELGAGVIVLGSRGLHGLRELAEGGVSHQVVTHARRPVLIVPAPQSRTERG
jgi:nucleotide-binding universal stress UspA family protein